MFIPLSSIVPLFTLLHSYQELHMCHARHGIVKGYAVCSSHQKWDSLPWGKNKDNHVWYIIYKRNIVYNPYWWRGWPSIFCFKHHKPNWRTVLCGLMFSLRPTKIWPTRMTIPLNTANICWFDEQKSRFDLIYPTQIVFARWWIELVYHGRSRLSTKTSIWMGDTPLPA